MAILNGRAGELSKLDNQATDGLLGTLDSLAYRVYEIETHLHSYERWYGVAASASGTHKADLLGPSIVAFEVDGGNNAWGSWVQILGSGDTVLKFDFDKIMFTYAERASQIHFVQFAFGADGDDAYAAGTYGTLIYRSGAAVSREAAVIIRTRRQAAGTEVWARCLPLSTDTAKVQFYLGLHTYPG